MTSPDVTTNFPNPVLTPIGTTTVKPNWTSLHLLQRQINANASSIHSNLGGGRNGHLALTIDAATYLAVAGVAFAVPPAPPDDPVLPANPTGPIITEANRLHLVAQKAFQRYHDADKALVRQIIAATPPTYIEALNDPDYGYANVTCLEMLTHLKTTYGRITIAEKDANHQRMTAPWHPPAPLEDLFSQIALGARLAAAGGEPLNDTQVARIGYNLVLQTGLFPDACREWRLKDDAHQTYAAFKTHFSRMEADRLESLTSASAGYQGAAHHVGSVPVQPSTLEADLAELALYRAASVANAVTAKHPHPPSSSAPPPLSYCWTHGSSRNTRHTSATCKNKSEGHQDTATLIFQQGGSTKVWTSTRRSPTV
jgi:hypothetical protein